MVCKRLGSPYLAKNRRSIVSLWPDHLPSNKKTNFASARHTPFHPKARACCKSSTAGGPIKLVESGKL